VSLEDALRYRMLLDWLKLNEVETAALPANYRDLRDECLEHGLIRFHLLTDRDSEPFVLGTDFYGESFDVVVDEMIANSHKP
jgi:hypothetical protein